MTYVDFCIAEVRKAGVLVRSTRGVVLEIMQKKAESRNEITAVDVAAGELLTTDIRAAYPAHSIYSEEGEHVLAGEYVWTIDPIDGTSNFARGIPHYGICLALLHDGVPIAGAVFNPTTDELFAFDEHGATLNGIPAHASAVTELKNAQALLHVGRKPELWDWGVRVYRELLERVKKTKDLGSSGLDLCFLAAGRADIVIYGTVTTADVASAIGMVRAAGGEVYTLAGEPVILSTTPQTVIATANRALFDNAVPLLHPELLPF